MKSMCRLSAVCTKAKDYLYIYFYVRLKIERWEVIINQYHARRTTLTPNILISDFASGQ